jgi:hypothetical protein
VTCERYRRPDDLGIERLGFKPYRALSEQARREVNKTGRESDYDHTFWKQEWQRDNVVWTRYEPELVRAEAV